MKLEYIGEKEDFVAFNQVYMRYQNRKRDIFFKAIGLICLLVSLYHIYKLISFYQVYQTFISENGFIAIVNYQSSRVFIAILYLILALFLFFNTKIQIKVRLKRAMNNPENRIYFSKKVIHFTEEKVIIKQGDSDSAIPWEMIVKVIETKQYIFLFNSSATGVLIPKKVIPKEMKQTLHEMIRAKTANQIIIDK